MVDLDWNGMWMEGMNEATWMKGCKDLNPQTARKRGEQYNKDALLREIGIIRLVSWSQSLE